MAVPAIAKGLLTFVLPSTLYSRSSGRTLSARYCYSVFLRHFRLIGDAGLPTRFETVAEIGPGASVGTGLAALAAGSKRYFGFDIKDYGTDPDNQRIFDEICELFTARAPVPGTGEFATIKPALTSDAFPHDILDDERLAAALAPDRTARIRAGLIRETGPVTYAAPWFESGQIEPESVDWIFSQATMEHVDDLAGTYEACARWLKPGGVMTHQIDYKSHGTAAAWNGHWAYSDVAWRMVRGARPYLINRQPHSAHLEALVPAGFDLLTVLPVTRADGLPRRKLAPRFRELSDDDLETAGAFVLARKRASDR